ncbi:hypothetical protein [Chryseobacterium luteum]|nr:hypothetical protein [Chryseobacterium luteum]
MIKALINLVIIFLFSSMAFAQKVSVLKDSVCISHECLELQEIKMDAKNADLYKQLQKSFDIFNGALFMSPEKRLQAKKDTLKDLISKNSLRESQFGFENYKILYDKKGLLNLSVGIQSYGSPWEDTKYYLFDMASNTEIGDRLFTGKKMLLKLFIQKLKAQEDQSFRVNNLSQYIINTDDTGKVTGLSLIFQDEKNRTNSGYPQYIVLFEWKEIEKFIVPEYKKSLLVK